jgi:hypothetical protein
MTIEPKSEDDLDVVKASLTKKFPDVDEAVIAEAVTQAHAPLTEAPIQEFVPVLVEHQAQVRLNEFENDTPSDSGAPPAAEQ